LSSIFPLVYLSVGIFHEKGFHFYTIENMSTFRYSFGNGYIMALLFLSNLFFVFYYFMMSIIYRKDYLYTENDRIFLRGKEVCLIEDVDMERTHRNQNRFWEKASTIIYTKNGKRIGVPTAYMIKINDAGFLPK